MDIIQLIKREVILFKKWLDEHYTPEQIQEEKTDDTGYPNWGGIEDVLCAAFRTLDFNLLENTVLEAITYLIARQWDIAIILHWFGSEEISQLGMTEEQLLRLAEYGLTSTEWSARQQYAASLFKIKTDKEKAQEIALAYHKDTNPDVRRFALQSLYKMQYKLLAELLLQSWSYGDELEQIQCLSFWQQLDNEKFVYFYKQVKNDTRPDLSNYVKQQDL